MSAASDYASERAIRAIGDLRGDIQNNLQPIVEYAMRNERIGVYTIPREVFAHIDFFGALYRGYTGETDRTGRRLIATSEKAVSFIVDVLGRVDPAYRHHGRLAYAMYRHGTVHVYRPHMLRRSDGATIEWVVYKGERRDAPIMYGRQAIEVSHLQPCLIRGETQRYLLPLSLRVLYEDLMAAIDIYQTDIREEVTRADAILLRNFSSTMSALMEADLTSETW